MDITRTHSHGSSVSSTIPVHIMRALGIRVGDHVIWIYNTTGFAEVRRLARPGEKPPRKPRRR